MWLGLIGWTVVLGEPHLRQVSGSWGYTETGTELLVRAGAGGGLSLYSHHPELQMGPLTFAAGLLILAFPPALRSTALWVAMTGAGVVVVAAVARMGQAARGSEPLSRWTVAVGGAAVLAAWSVLAIPGGHLDDVLALGFAVGAWAAYRQDRWDLAAVLLAGAVDSKPWAVAFLPLLVGGHRPAGRRVLTLGVFTAAVTVVWAPFLLGDRDVSALGSLRIPNAADSALRVLGFGGSMTPTWDRPVEFAGGIAVGLVALARGRASGVLLGALAVRLLLDPGTHTYYTAGLLLAALAFDVAGTSWTMPWTSLTGFVLLFVPHLVLAEPGLAVARGWLRAGCTVGLIVLVTLAPTALLRRRNSPVLRRRHADPAGAATVVSGLGGVRSHRGELGCSKPCTDRPARSPSGEARAAAGQPGAGAGQRRAGAGEPGSAAAGVPAEVVAAVGSTSRSRSSVSCWPRGSCGGAAAG